MRDYTCQSYDAGVRGISNYFTAFFLPCPRSVLPPTPSMMDNLRAHFLPVLERFPRFCVCTLALNFKLKKMTFIK